MSRILTVLNFKEKGQKFEDICLLESLLKLPLSSHHHEKLKLKILFYRGSEAEKTIFVIRAGESVKDAYGDANWFLDIGEKQSFFSFLLTSLSRRFMKKKQPVAIEVPKKNICDDAYINLPRILQWRRGKLAAWLADPPLTTVGRHAARMYAERLISDNLIKPEMLGDCVYASPDFSCVQTLDMIMQVVDPSRKIKIRIEPGLSANYKGLTKQKHVFVDADEFHAQGILRVDTAYKPVTQLVKKLNLSKRIEAFKAMLLEHPGKIVILVLNDETVNEILNSCKSTDMKSEKVEQSNEDALFLHTFFVKMVGKQWTVMNSIVLP
ncbi:Ubiquitin-associated and SH3 domain-containing protein B [Trichinella zimbabwensis]|uniref:Ubiquitin-associated and SH3 domain-containing protein B n=1 Tax=Trichinella zimbabwensis TaxID=268475 RepID=A0A0V1HSJ6_9BILA|nr:Ubiquitin-associated and SH3 domain-containing protein B [Trichinella zimbabwensis]